VVRDIKLAREGTELLELDFVDHDALLERQRQIECSVLSAFEVQDIPLDSALCHIPVGLVIVIGLFGSSSDWVLLSHIAKEALEVLYVCPFFCSRLAWFLVDEDAGNSYGSLKDNFHRFNPQACWQSAVHLQIEVELREFLFCHKGGVEFDRKHVEVAV